MHHPLQPKRDSTLPKFRHQVQYLMSVWTHMWDAIVVFYNGFLNK